MCSAHMCGGVEQSGIKGGEQVEEDKGGRG